MTPVVFVIVWLAQATVLGLIALALPRLVRMREPWRLESWWAWGALGVVVLPVLPTVLPGRPATPPALATFVDSTSVGVAARADVPGSLSALDGLFLVWACGAVLRLAWLVAGQRRLRRLADAGHPIVDDPALADARRIADAWPRVLAARAPVSVVATDDIGPCAFGWSTVRVLVPRTLSGLPADQRTAVYLHELLHAARFDVQRGYADEAWRLAWWWQPGVWWMLSRVRLAREFQVDRAVVAALGMRRAYVEALLWCGARRPERALSAPVVGSRHALVGRVTALCEEVEMSNVRRWVTMSVLALTFSVASAVMSAHAPLSLSQVRAVMPDGVGEPGPLERAAVVPTLDEPAPARTFAVEPVWTEPAAYRFRVNVVLDDSGRVAEARVVGTPSIANAPDDLKRRMPAARQSALDAVRQWQFAPPPRAPMLLTADVIVGDPRQLSPHVTRPDGLASPMREPLRVGGTIGPPRKIHDVQPIYPQDAMDAKVQGVVIVECTIDPEGRVSDARVVRGIPLLDQAALDAVEQWRYTPTWLNGEAVPVMMTMTINFSLK